MLHVKSQFSQGYKVNEYSDSGYGGEEEPMRMNDFIYGTDNIYYMPQYISYV